ncbi:MAG: nicotinate phosphoribosyltransferase [Burkholderiaceae bacterium]|nr:nicotinate phosphoribosyltransferase [Burkholderiaceae bacterium]
MSALLTDLYQLTMLQAYLEEDLQQTAVFELFVRKLPPQRRFGVAAGLEQALQFLESLAFSDEELQWLAAQHRFSARLIDHLAQLRFAGDVDAMPEGSIFFANEPILRVTAPLPQAQLVESRLLNIVHLQTLIASKAARVVMHAGGRQLVDFGMRRAHGEEAALMAARAAYLAGFDATATAEAGRRFGMPVVGTMAHSFVQAHASESAAFEAFARVWPQRPILLIDTYDTEAGAQKVVALAQRLASAGLQIGGVRLDSGDLAAHARAVRGLFDAAGQRALTIFASGNLDEHRIASLVSTGAPIDGFGVGTALDTSSDAPAIDMVYKLQAYAGEPKRKRSEGKATWPGAKQVCRRRRDDGTLLEDRVQLLGEPVDATPLLQPCMRSGRRLQPAPSLAQVRAFHAEQRAMLPPELRLLEPSSQPFEPVISQALRDMTARIDAAAAARP